MEKSEVIESRTDNQTQESEGSNLGLYLISFGSLAVLIGIVVYMYILKH